MDQNRPVSDTIEGLREYTDLDSQQFDFLKNYLSIRHLYNGGIKEVVTKLEVLDEEFRVKYERNPIHRILYR